MMAVDEFQRWRDDPLTVKFFEFVTDYRQNLMEQWATGGYTSPSLEQEALINSRQMGRALMLNELSNLADDAISEFYRQSTKGSDDVPGNQEDG